MVRSLSIFVATLAIASTSFAQGKQEFSGARAAPIEVMVLATYHMSNPGHDAVNMQVDDVLQPKRQQELEAVAKQLGSFRPTKIAVEAISPAPTYVWKAALDPADLKTQSNERYQLGERLALHCGLDKLYGVDTDGDFNSEPVKVLDDRQTGGARTRSMLAGIQAFVDESDRKQHTMTIGQSLAWMNTPEAIKRNNNFYMESLLIADGDSQPAAKLDADWYERNLRIWGKVLQTAKPGDRIILVYGQGHAYWLRALVQEMPGYKLVDPLRYLNSAGQ